MLTGVLVARTEDACDVSVIIGKSGECPFSGNLLGYAVGVEQIAHAHDILVVVMLFVAYPLGLQFLNGCFYGFFQMFVPAGLSGGNGVLLLAVLQFDVERPGFGIEEYIGIVGQAAQPGDIFAFHVTFAVQQPGVVIVGLLKGPGIKLQILFMILRYAVCQEKNADTGATDGGVGEERVRIFPDAFQQFLQPVVGNMVNVC